MSYRVQFTVTDDEKEQLRKKAEEQGFPNIAEYCKFCSLGKNNTAELYKQLVARIEKLPAGQKFFLRDIIPNPPILMGRWLFDNVAKGNITNVIHLGKIGADAEQYQKM